MTPRTHLRQQASRGMIAALPSIARSTGPQAACASASLLRQRRTGTNSPEARAPAAACGPG